MKTILTKFYTLVILSAFAVVPMLSHAQQGDIPGDIVDPQSVTVNWAQTSLENTKTDKSGSWFYKIKSAGTVFRDLDEAIHLNLEKIDAANNVQVITLVTYEPGALYFNVEYPPCPDTGKNCDQVDKSPVEAGYTYQLYFSDVENARGTIINFDNLVKPLTAPEYRFNGDVITGLNHLLKDNGVRQWYSVSGTVAQSVPNDLFEIFLRDANGEEVLLGRVQANPGTKFTLPQVNSQNLFDINPEVNHTVLIRHGSKIVQTYAITGSTTNTTDDDNINNGNGGIVYNTTQQDIINGGIVSKTCGYKLSEGGRICGFGDVVSLIQRIIEYIFVLILPIAAIMFAYAGFLYLTSGGDTGKRSKAKDVMLNLLKGIILVMAAWLIVKTILVALGAEPEITKFLGIKK